MVDVVSRRCEEAECRRRPLYGHEGQKGRFCSYHKASYLVFCFFFIFPRLLPAAAAVVGRNELLDPCVQISLLW